MVSLIIQTLLLIAVAFTLGAVIGSLLRMMLGAKGVQENTAIEHVDSAGVSPPVKAVAKSAAIEDPIVPHPPMPPALKTPGKSPKGDATRLASPVGIQAAKTNTIAPGKPRVPIKRPADIGSATPDNLKLIRGIGPQNEGWLNELGVNTFKQVAAWSTKDETYFGDVLAFPGRIEREEWVKQAKVLAKGGSTDFAKRVRSGIVAGNNGNVVTPSLGSKPKGLLKEAKDGKPDNLTLIDGVGNAIENKMTKLGIFHFDQVAQLSGPELTWLGNAVGFPGRPERENWAGEAKSLATTNTPDQLDGNKRGAITSKK